MLVPPSLVGKDSWPYARGGAADCRHYTCRVGDWYPIGVAVGAGVALGVLAAGLLARSRAAALLAALAGAVAGAAAGLVVARWLGDDWVGPVAGALGGLAGGGSAAVVAAGALRRGATPGGTALLLAGAALAVAALALVPVVGYAEALAAPIAAARARRKAPERHAGLRSLAK